MSVSKFGLLFLKRKEHIFNKKIFQSATIDTKFFIAAVVKSLHLVQYQSSCPQLFSFKKQFLIASFTVASYTAFSSVR